MMAAYCIETPFGLLQRNYPQTLEGPFSDPGVFGEYLNERQQTEALPTEMVIVSNVSNGRVAGTGTAFINS